MAGASDSSSSSGSSSSSSKSSDSSHAPIVVDMGKKRRKEIKRLREGRGKLMDEVSGLMEELRTAGSISSSAQPVVVVVRQKRKGRSLMWPLA